MASRSWRRAVGVAQLVSLDGGRALLRAKATAHGVCLLLYVKGMALQPVGRTEVATH